MMKHPKIIYLRMFFQSMRRILLVCVEANRLCPLHSVIVASKRSGRRLEQLRARRKRKEPFVVQNFSNQIAAVGLNSRFSAGESE